MARGKYGRRVSRSSRAGLTFPISRVRNQLKKKLGKGLRVSWTASTYATAVLEYLTAEVAEISGYVTRDNKLKRVSPRHIAIAVWKDEELAKLCRKVTFPSAGVVPNIHTALLGKPKQAAASVQNPTSPAKVARTAPAAKTPALKKVGKKVAMTKKAQKGGKGRGGGGRAAAAGGAVTTLGQRTLNAGQKITVLSGDITDVKTDALTYSSGGQVATRVAQVGGNGLQQKETTTGKDYVNGVRIYQAVNLPCSHIIRCSAPTWGGSNAATAIGNLENTIKSCLRAAEDEKLKSVSFPSIGSGGAGYPKQTAAQTILRSISDYFKSAKKSSIQEVFFVLYDKQSVNVYVSELQRLIE